MDQRRVRVWIRLTVATRIRSIVVDNEELECRDEVLVRA